LGAFKGFAFPACQQQHKTVAESEKRSGTKHTTQAWAIMHATALLFPGIATVAVASLRAKAQAPEQPYSCLYEVQWVFAQSNNVILPSPRMLLLTSLPTIASCSYCLADHVLLLELELPQCQ
jgi:hypothetical protein